MDMRWIEDRYISLLTDFGFKRIFGTKPNKDLLINFLNSLFDGLQVIKDVKYLNSEHVGDVFAERKPIFDVYCENEHGEKFIVEMQNAYFPIREQAPKGAEWNFQHEHVYTVALLNFDLKESLSLKTLKVFLSSKPTSWLISFLSNASSFKYVEIAKFNKTEEELDTLYDKWLYVLKNLSRLDERPSALKEKVFTKLFEEAEIAKFTPTELKEYEDSLKAYRDVKNSIDTALEKGREEGMAKCMAEGMAEGMAKEKIATARRLLSMGLSEEQVSTATELPLEEIQKLRE